MSEFEAQAIKLLTEIRDLLVEIKDPLPIRIPSQTAAAELRRQWREEIGL